MWLAGSTSQTGSPDRSVEPATEVGRDETESTDEPEVNMLLRVRVLLRNLEWGGDTIAVPCGYAVGTVLHGVLVADGSPQVRCDFGAHLGVQTVAEASCEYVPYTSSVEVHRNTSPAA